MVLFNLLKKNGVILIILSLLSTAFFSSCTPVIVGGGLVAGSYYLDRRSAGAVTDDQFLKLNIFKQTLDYINKSDNPKRSTVSVLSYNRTVLLLGHVAKQDIRSQAEKIAKSYPAVKNVYNFITVEGDRNYQGIASDSWITSKVRTMLLDAKGFSPNHVKITTYDSVTYVMGLLTPAEQQIVSKKVSTTNGVKKVVTLYETYSSSNDK